MGAINAKCKLSKDKRQELKNIDVKRVLPCRSVRFLSNGQRLGVELNGPELLLGTGRTQRKDPEA